MQDIHIRQAPAMPDKDQLQNSLPISQFQRQRINVLPAFFPEQNSKKIQSQPDLQSAT